MNAFKEFCAAARRALARKLVNDPVAFPPVTKEHESLPKTHRILRPLILGRVALDGIEDDTTPQFLSYGWSKGTFNYLTEPVYKMVHDLLSAPDVEWNVRNNTIDFKSGLTVRTVEITQVSGYEFYGDPHVAMFFTASAVGNSNQLLGGPSAALLKLIQEIALKIECRIVTIETGTDDTALVIFKAWGNEFSPTAIAEHYNDSLIP
jgi:hypothetical protein